jgi:hypothetical protein
VGYSRDEAENAPHMTLRYMSQTLLNQLGINPFKSDP